MNNEKRIFTSESVTEGIDKVCDRVSDSDARCGAGVYNPMARVACECTATGVDERHGRDHDDCYVDIPKVVRKAICEIGWRQRGGGL